MLWKVGMTTGFTLLGVGEFPGTGEFGAYLQWGALGILMLSTIKLFAELSAQRADAKSERETHAAVVKELCTRWDGWEKTRHDDHETLNSTLTAMRENCASVIHNQSR